MSTMNQALCQRLKDLPKVAQEFHGRARMSTIATATTSEGTL